MLKVRKAKPSDAAGIAAIYNESILAGAASMDEEPKDAEVIQSWIAEFTDREGIWVLESESGVLGWGLVKKYSERSGYRFACETAVYISRSHTGHGYGTMLKKEIIQKCRAYGYHHLVAKIMAGNEPSIRYNKKLGYEVVGRQREIGYLNGMWHDVIIMQLILS